MSVHVVSMPAWARGKRFIPSPPPIFGTLDPSPRDVGMARALLDALDDESKEWYRIRYPELIAKL